MRIAGKILGIGVFAYLAIPSFTVFAVGVLAMRSENSILPNGKPAFIATFKSGRRLESLLILL
jgi:hypothetical protein